MIPMGYLKAVDVKNVVIARRSSENSRPCNETALPVVKPQHAVSTRSSFTQLQVPHSFRPRSTAARLPKKILQSPYLYQHDRLPQQKRREICPDRNLLSSCRGMEDCFAFEHSAPRSGLGWNWHCNEPSGGPEYRFCPPCAR